MDVHLPLLRGLGIVTRVCELPRSRTQDCGIPTVVEDSNSRDDHSLRPRKRKFLGPEREVARTRRADPPAIAQPTRCASQ